MGIGLKQAVAEALDHYISVVKPAIDSGDCSTAYFELFNLLTILDFDRQDARAHGENLWNDVHSGPSFVAALNVVKGALESILNGNSNKLDIDIANSRIEQFKQWAKAYGAQTALPNK